jgi:hypothetical protein
MGDEEGGVAGWSKAGGKRGSEEEVADEEGGKKKFGE